MIDVDHAYEGYARRRASRDVHIDGSVVIHVRG